MFIFACFSIFACYGNIARFLHMCFFVSNICSNNLTCQRRLTISPAVNTLFVMSCFTTMRRIRGYRYTGVYGIPVYRPSLRSQCCFPSHIPPIFQQHHQPPVTLFFICDIFIHCSFSQKRLCIHFEETIKTVFAVKAFIHIQ